MRWTHEKIYAVELEKAHDEGFDGEEAERVAKIRAVDRWWELVDRGRQEAKDRD